MKTQPQVSSFDQLLGSLIKVPKGEVLAMEAAELKENRRKRVEQAIKKPKRPQR